MHEALQPPHRALDLFPFDHLPRNRSLLAAFRSDHPVAEQR
jgi:hypothetical protein